jgi:hypothetical protein
MSKIKPPSGIRSISAKCDRDFLCRRTEHRITVCTKSVKHKLPPSAKLTEDLHKEDRIEGD